MALRCLKFSRKTLLRAIAEASGARDDGKDADQSRYLASYLDHDEAGTKSLIVESPYTDRHYLEEYSGYYATAFRPPSQTCTRIHAFREELTDEQLKEAVRDAAAGKLGDVEKRLRTAYLGFVVVRPIPSAPIGRTILSTYGERVGRNYGPSIAPSRVHFAGLELSVEGVPFQQQDQAVGACATTAIWSSLSRVIRADGGRAPTPLAVTTQANKHVLTGRPLPAVGGLELGQMLGAIREIGYSPHVLKPGNTPEIFHAAIQTYVASGIPAILQIKPAETELHAIAITGFWSDPEAAPLEIKVSESRSLKVRPMTKLYVHDDRLGPYARMKILELPSATPQKKSKKKKEETTFLPDIRIQVWPHEEDFEAFEVPSTIWHAIVPLYPKIRLSAEDLIRVAQEALPLFETLAGPGRLIASMKFVLSGSYLSELLRMGMDPNRAADICIKATLPRYVGVVRFEREGEWFGDVICDTTEIYREQPRWGRVIGLLARDAAQVPELEKVRVSFELDALIA